MIKKKYIYIYNEGSIQGTILRGDRRREKVEKQGKAEVKKKWLVLAKPPYSPQRNGKQSVVWKP